MSIQQDSESIRVTPARARVEELALGPEVLIDGALYLECALTLSGRIEGEVHCRTLIVETDGVIDGRVVAEEVIVEGTVLGEIYSPKLILRSCCNVEAAIYYRDLLLEKGAFFEGKFRRSNDPLSQILDAAEDAA